MTGGAGMSRPWRTRRARAAATSWTLFSSTSRAHVSSAPWMGVLLATCTRSIRKLPEPRRVARDQLRHYAPRPAGGQGSDGDDREQQILFMTTEHRSSHRTPVRPRTPVQSSLKTTCTASKKKRCVGQLSARCQLHGQNGCDMPCQVNEVQCKCDYCVPYP